MVFGVLFATQSESVLGLFGTTIGKLKRYCCHDTIWFAAIWRMSVESQKSAILTCWFSVDLLTFVNFQFHFELLITIYRHVFEVVYGLSAKYTHRPAYTYSYTFTTHFLLSYLFIFLSFGTDMYQLGRKLHGHNCIVSSRHFIALLLWLLQNFIRPLNDTTAIIYLAFFRFRPYL